MKIEGFVNIYAGGRAYGPFFATKDIADQMSYADRVACVKVSGEYEITVIKDDR